MTGRHQEPGYGVYQESRRSKNYFGGGTGLGTVTDPQATLDVGGDLRLRGDATVHLDAATPDGDGKATKPSAAVAHGLAEAVVSPGTDGCAAGLPAPCFPGTPPRRAFPRSEPPAP